MKTVKKQFDKCPYCGNIWAYQEDMTLDDDRLYIDYTCGDCHKRWQEAWNFQDTWVLDEYQEE